MSDFTSEFWHYYVAGLTLVSIIACLILLWISGTTKAATLATTPLVTCGTVTWPR